MNEFIANQSPAEMVFEAWDGEDDNISCYMTAYYTGPTMTIAPIQVALQFGSDTWAPDLPAMVLTGYPNGTNGIIEDFANNGSLTLMSEVGAATNDPMLTGGVEAA